MSSGGVVMSGGSRHLNEVLRKNADGERDLKNTVTDRNKFSRTE